MQLPRGDEYNMSVQNPSFCFSDSDLKMGTVQTNKLGLPIPYSGGFTTTYKVKSDNLGWAVRCFTREVGHLQKRYQAIDEFIEKKGHDYLVEARYIKFGIQVNNKWFSIIKMHWIEGDLLNVHIGKIVHDKVEVDGLLKKFVHLTEKLNKDKIAHGDLQHGNIIVKNDKLFLIDYDGMFLPEINEVGTEEIGHPSYQHPKRTVSCFDNKLDRFSSLVIYLALKALSLKPSLWKKYNNAENILFKKEDFSDPLNSELFYELSQITELKHLANNLVYVCMSDFAKIPSLKDFINDKSEFGKITINTPKTSNTGNGNDFFGDLYKQKTTTGGFQYKPTSTLQNPVIKNATANSVNNSSSNPTNNPVNKPDDFSFEKLIKAVPWILAIGVIGMILYGATTTSPSSSYNTTDNNVVDTSTTGTCTYDEVKDSAGNCITRDQDCQNKDGINSSWDGSSCVCDTGYSWDSSYTYCTIKPVSSVSGCVSMTGYSKTTGLSCSGDGSCASGSYVYESSNKCMTPLKYCQNLNGTYGTYDSSSNSCGCLSGYIIGGTSKQCVSLTEGRDQSCAAKYPGTSFLKYDTDGTTKICDCEYGYYWNSDRTACYSLASYNQSCVSSYGQGSYSTTENGKRVCDCTYGYSFNAQRNMCVTTASIDAICERDIGRNSTYKGTVTDGKYNCTGPY